MIRLIKRWLIAREINRNLAARKRLRPQRSQAAKRGWQTRRAKSHT